MHETTHCLSVVGSPLLYKSNKCIDFCFCSGFAYYYVSVMFYFSQFMLISMLCNSVSFLFSIFHINVFVFWTCMSCLLCSGDQYSMLMSMAVTVITSF